MVFPHFWTDCSRVPRPSATLTREYCYPQDPVRLACLIHATSVRSEPESNSQKKTLELTLELPRGAPGITQTSFVFRFPSGDSPSVNRLPGRALSALLAFKDPLPRPVGLAASRVANERIVYHKFSLRARGCGKKSENFFRRGRFRPQPPPKHPIFAPKTP